MDRLKPIREYTTLVSVDESQEKGDCIFCGKELHFYVNSETGQWDCKRCLRKGNIPTFLSQLCDHFFELTTKEDRQRIAENRGLPSKVFKWRRFACLGDAKWIFPVYLPNGSITDVRRWNEGTRLIRSTYGCKVGLYGAEQFNDVRKLSWPVYLTEGEWDAIALRWLVNELHINAIVVGVPGANTFKRDWIPWFADREVIACYDADNAGDMANAKVPTNLANTARRIRYVCWPWDLPDGYDIRDLVTSGGVENPKKIWDALQNLIADKPRFGLENERKQGKALSGGAGTGSGPSKGSDVPTGRIEPYAGKKVLIPDLVKAYGKNLLVTEETEIALAVIYATVLGTQLEGDPLWVYIVGPPGSGKTELLTPFSEVDSCIVRSTVTAKSLASGFNINPDPSLIPKLQGKTLVLKDVTEIITGPVQEVEKVFSTLRGAYDGSLNSNWGNGVVRNYPKVHFHVIGAVTNIVHGHSVANRGERFLKLQLTTNKKKDKEALIWSAIESSGQEKAIREELLVTAKAFLDSHTGLTMGELKKGVPRWAIKRIVALSQIISKLRANVDREKYRSDMISSRPQEEVGTRLAKQLFKIAAILPEIYGEKFSEKHARIIERIAFDTSIGWHLEMVEAFIKYRDRDYLTIDDFVKATNLPHTNIIRKIEDLIILGVIRRRKLVQHARAESRNFYVLDPEIYELWEQAKVSDKTHGKRAVQVRRRKVKDNA